MSRRPWLIPAFAFASLWFIALQYVEIQGTYDSYGGPSPVLFIGVCFIGQTMFELSELAHNRTRFLPLIMCIVLAALIAFLYLLTPPNPGHLWYWGYVPLFILIVVEISLLWSLVPKESNDSSDLVGLKIKYSFLLLFLLTLLGGVNSMYGQMVSFFFMTVPVVLAWEEVIDRSAILTRSARNDSMGQIIRSALAMTVYFVAGFVGFFLGNSFWAT